MFDEYHNDSLCFFTVSEDDDDAVRKDQEGILDSDGIDEVLRRSEDLGWLSSQDCIRIDPFFRSLKSIGVTISYVNTGFVERGKLKYVKLMFDEYIADVNAKNLPYYTRTFDRMKYIIDFCLEKNKNILMMAD